MPARILETPETQISESNHSKSGMSDEGRKFLYPDEVDKLIKAARQGKRHGARNALMILMAYRHGLRVSELLNLKWSDIDWSTPQIHIKRSKGSNDSTQPLYPDQCRLLRIQEKAVKKQGKDRGLVIPYIFPSDQARVMDPSTFRKLLYDLSVDWEFRVHPHMLRHACGFYLANKGYDLRRIQSYLGHRNISNTVIYTQLSSRQFEGLWD